MDFKGKIDISDNAIKEIAVRGVCAVLEVTDERRIKRIRKSLDIERSPEDNVIVNIRLTLPFGKPLVGWGKNIMERVKFDIERMTDLQVLAVNVTVEDIEESEMIQTKEDESAEEENEQSKPIEEKE